MRAVDNRIRRHQLILGAVFAAASVILLLMIDHLGVETEVMNVYFVYADELFHGNIPNMEYPPLALLFFAIPRLFSSDPFGYEVAFAVQAVVFFIIGMLIVSKLAKRYNQSQHQAMLVYTVLMMIMIEFVICRNDIFPAMITLFSFYCLVTKRYVWAFFLLAIATSSMVYPIILLPIYVIPFILNRDWTNIIKGGGVFVIVVSVVMLVTLLVGSDMVPQLIQYHLDRPLQIESTAASVIALAGMLGLTTVRIEFGFGSDNLIGTWPDAVAPYLFPLLLISLALIYVLNAYMTVRLRKERRDNENNRMMMLGGTVLISILLVMVVWKSFSAQYLIWPYPLSFIS